MYRRLIAGWFGRPQYVPDRPSNHLARLKYRVLMHKRVFLRFGERVCGDQYSSLSHSCIRVSFAIIHILCCIPRERRFPRRQQFAGAATKAGPVPSKDSPKPLLFYNRRSCARCSLFHLLWRAPSNPDLLVYRESD